MTQYPVDMLTDTERKWLRNMPGRAQTIVLDVVGDPHLNPARHRVADLAGKGRAKTLSRLRWAIWARMREQRDSSGQLWSYPRIAAWFGVDHGSVHHGVRRHAELHPQAA